MKLPMILNATSVRKIICEVPLSQFHRQAALGVTDCHPTAEINKTHASAELSHQQFKKNRK